MSKNNVLNAFSFGFGGITESDKHIVNDRGSSGSGSEVINFDKRTFREHFEAEKISRCNCGRRACSQSV